MKKYVICFILLILVFSVIPYMRHVPSLAGENIEKISVIVYTGNEVKEYTLPNEVRLPEGHELRGALGYDTKYFLESDTGRSSGPSRFRFAGDAGVALSPFREYRSHVGGKSG